MSALGSLILSNTYRDSVFLMKISSKVQGTEGVIEASAMMGTDRNKDLFAKSNLSDDKVKNCKSDDLVIAIRANDDEALKQALKLAEEMLNETVSNQEDTGEEKVVRLEDALQRLKDANVLMVSCAGDYAKYEACKGLSKGMNIMLYSDNVSVEDELALKKLAHSKGLIVMGPDCGTSIINGIPLAFANKIRKGSIGVVGASGTGIQETTSIIHRYGGGVFEAFGTGGRDPKEEIGGITMMDCLELLKDSEEVNTILIVSKPPHVSVQEKIAKFIKSTNKPVVCNFAGATDYSIIENAGGYGVDSLEGAALKAVELAGYGKPVVKEYDGVDLNKLDEEIKTLKPSQKYLRGIYGGGSVCYEAMFNASKVYGDDVVSNTPIHGMKKLDDVQVSEKHTFLDMGEDEFTVGKPHPMIDPTQKAKRLVKEIGDPEVAVVLTDCEIGYGSSDNPAQAIADSIKEAGKKYDSKAIVVASVCGVEEDFQSLSGQVKILKDAGVYVTDSNYQAIKLCLEILKKKGV